MTDERTRVAAVAMHSAMGDVETNLGRVAYWAERAKSEGATFAVFPEECITGSLNKSKMTFEQAREIVDQGAKASAPRLHALCRRLEMTLVVGAIEPAGERFRNSALIVGPAGHLATYSKLHLPNEAELKWFVPGERVVVVTSQGWMFSVGICADLNYPEVFRAAARAGAEFFLLAVGCSGDGTPESAVSSMREYSRLMYACAVANGLYIFYADQAGPDRVSLAFSQNLHGEVVDSCAGKEGLVVTDVSREAIRKARAGGDPANLFRVRPEAYANPLVVKA